jgi:tRNA(Ile)-lysidine synthase
LKTHFEADASLVPPDERVLVAVSSGADSLALLLWLHALQRDMVVAHINHDLHELRAGDCDRDEAWVQDTCARLQVPLEVRRLNLARKNGHVNENVARIGRYEALIEMAHESGAKRVATADGLETALLNLTRGGGPRGWMGFAPLRTLQAATSAHEALLLVRPLWKVGREELRAALKQEGWTWREDPSNQDALFRRNRMRHEVLPLLAEIGGQPTDQLARSYALNAHLARDELAYLESQTVIALEALVKKRQQNLLVLDGVGFLDLPVALQRRVLRAAAQQIVPDLRDLAGSKVEQVRLAVVGGQKRAVWTWRKEFRVEWTGAGSGNRLRFWLV